MSIKKKTISQIKEVDRLSKIGIQTLSRAVAKANKEKHNKFCVNSNKCLSHIHSYLTRYTYCTVAQTLKVKDDCRAKNTYRTVWQLCGIGRGWIKINDCGSR